MKEKEDEILHRKYHRNFHKCIVCVLLSMLLLSAANIIDLDVLYNCNSCTFQYLDEILR